MPGRRPGPDRYRNQFIPNIGKTPMYLKVDQFISNAKDNFRRQQIGSWVESETCARTDIFGKIAQRFSTYSIRLTANGVESRRAGINAIQLIKVNDSWLISAVAWDKETES